MRISDVNFQQYDDEIIKASMDRLEAAALIVMEKAKQNIRNQVLEYWKEHGPYRRRYITDRAASAAANKKVKKLIPYSMGSADPHTARWHHEIVNSVRIHRDDKAQNVWILAGNRNAYWAEQMEFGSGAWRGGAKPFMRPAMAESADKVYAILEGGATGEVELNYGK